MPQLYTRTYTYTGQSSFNNNNEKRVSLSSFSVSGDTEYIAQIVKITFSHYHSSSSKATWYTRCRLGGSYISDTTSKSVAKNAVVLFENTFTSNFPPVSVFNNKTGYVETLYSRSSNNNYTTDGGYDFTWAASTRYPMTLTVQYYDVEPTYYKPLIEKFSVERVNSSLQKDDTGEYALATIKLGLGIQTTTRTVEIYRSTTEGNIGTLFRSLTPNEITNALSGEMSITLGSSTNNFSSLTTYYFTLKFIAGQENETVYSSQYILPRAFAALHISGCKNGGVAIGGFSSSTEDETKFEVVPPAYFYGGIAQIGNSSADTLTALGVQGGTIAATNISLNGYVDGTVIFDKEFDVAPSVATAIFATDTAGNYTDYSAGECIVLLRSIGTEGFTYRLKNGRGSARSIGFTWVAIGASGGTNTGGGSSSGGGEGGGEDDGGNTNSKVEISEIHYNATNGIAIATISIDETSSTIYAPITNTIAQNLNLPIASSAVYNVQQAAATAVTTANNAASAATGAIKSIKNPNGTSFTVTSGSVTLPAGGTSYGLVVSGSTSITTATAAAQNGYTACPVIGGIPYYKAGESGGMEYTYGSSLPPNGSTGDLFFLI